jgi:hypothetical protein
VSSDFEIYLITAPGYWYVGSTRVGHQKRFAQHKKPRSGCIRLREKMTELGSDAFSIQLLEKGIGDPLGAEASWYERCLEELPGTTLNSRRPGAYPEKSLAGRERIAEAARQRTGWHHSEEAKKKIAAKAIGRVDSNHTRVRRSTSHIGLKHSATTRQSISKALRGRKFTDETRAKMAESAKRRGIRVP